LNCPNEITTIAPLLFDAGLSFLFSRELVERLGDCLPKGQVFVPMGLV
jgi:hypothetical protein